MRSTVLLFALLGVPVAASSQGLAVDDPSRDTAPELPRWTDITHFTARQEGQFLTLEVQTADSIPRTVGDSCAFRFFFHVGPGRAGGDHSAGAVADYVAEFNLRNWDGAPWYATFMTERRGGAGLAARPRRMFDWQLLRDRFRLRFSMTTLHWTALRVQAEIYYRAGSADMAPDSGAAGLTLDTTQVPALVHRQQANVQLTYPAPFDTVCTRYGIMHAIGRAYRLERELSGVRPEGGDTVRFVFDPYIGGAALEGDPIKVGPSMWGSQPLWFVYFHEMGHNFCNASASFRQLYPLEFSSRPGPLPAHLLFYEAFASLPAMYVLEKMAAEGGPDTAMAASIRREWDTQQKRFAEAWDTYRKKPTPQTLTPDVVDGLLLELRKRFGWQAMKRFFALLRPQESMRPLFDTKLAGDTPDLRVTRTTLTAALLSAATAADLSSELRQSGLAVDDGLFRRALTQLTAHQPARGIP